VGRGGVSLVVGDGGGGRGERGRELRGERGRESVHLSAF
jgi:hypothetical protein